LSSEPIDFLGEGPTDATVIRRLIAHVGGLAGQDFTSRRAPRGKDQLDRRLPGIEIAARHGSRVFVLRDLDKDAACPGELVARLLPGRPASLLLRVAVRSVDAWLMADRPGIASALDVTRSAVPPHPETIADAKGALRDLARQSRDRATREIAFESPQAFAGLLESFAAETWRIERALESGAAPSLRRAIERLAALCA
jgi:hypothetical protein